MKKAIRRFIISLNKTPLKIVLKMWYGLALWALKNRLTMIREIKSIAVSGSLSIGEPLYGKSDIDLFIVIDCPDYKRELMKRRIRNKLRHMHLIFPFIGPVEERMHGVYFLDDLVKGFFPEMFYSRAKTILYTVLYAAEDFVIPGIEEPLSKGEIIEEIKLIIKLVINRIIHQDDTPYFWRTKIRCLLVFYQNSLSLETVKPLFTGNEYLFTVLSNLMKKSAADLYFTPPSYEEKGNLCDILFALINAIFDKNGFYSIDTIEITVDKDYSLKRTPVPLTMNDVEPLDVDLCIPPRFWLRTKEKIAWDKEFIGYSLKTATYSTLTESLQQIITSNSMESNIWVALDDVMLFIRNGMCERVYSSFDTPTLFTKRYINKTTVSYPQYFYARTRNNLVHDLKTVQEAYYEPLINKSDREPVSMDSLIYFADIQRTLTGFFLIHTAKCFFNKTLKSYASITSIFKDLNKRYAEHAALFDYLTDYFDIQNNRKKKDESVTNFPPNLIPTAVDFFCHYLYDKKWDGLEQLDRRLTISLCICTKDRAHFLAPLMDSIKIQTRMPDEIVIIDNGTTDTTQALVEQYKRDLPIRIIVDKAKGIPRLRNRAIKESTGEIISFTDDDCILDKNWVYFVEESFLKDSSIGAVGGLVHHYPEHQGSIINTFHEEYLGVRY